MTASTMICQIIFYLLRLSQWTNVDTRDNLLIKGQRRLTYIKNKSRTALMDLDSGPRQQTNGSDLV